MARRRQCAKCGEYSAWSAKECDGCGVLFADLQREQQKPKRDPVTCAFEDHGGKCPCRGILALSTNGDGPWYCREHIQRVQGRKPTEVGNAMPAAPSSQAVRKWHEQWKAKFGDRKLMGEKPAMPRYEREPGEDFEELIES